MPIRDDLEAKIREISGESSWDTLKRQPRTQTAGATFLTTALLVLLALTTNLFAPIWGTEESRLLDRLAKSFGKAVEIQQDVHGQQFWRSYSEEQNEMFGPKVSELGLQQDRSNLEESLYQATFDLWSLSLSTELPTEDEMKKARKSLVTSAEQISTEQGVNIEIPELASKTVSLINHTTAAGDFRWTGK